MNRDNPREYPQIILYCVSESFSISAALGLSTWTWACLGFFCPPGVPFSLMAYSRGPTHRSGRSGAGPVGLEPHLRDGAPSSSPGLQDPGPVLSPPARYKCSGKGGLVRYLLTLYRFCTRERIPAKLMRHPERLVRRHTHDY